MKIVVDLKKVYQNAVFVRKNTGTNICAVIKGDAYGHGAVKVAKTLEEEVQCFAVAHYCEARALCVAGIKKDIIILGKDRADGEKNVIESAISLADYEQKKKEARINIALNTGMNRVGLTPNEFKSLKRLPQNVYSVFSHVYSEESLDAQTKLFDDLLDSVEGDFFRHLYSTNCLQAKKQYDFARVGIGLYGYGAEGLLPAMSVYAEVVAINEVRKGDNVGYGRCVMKNNAVIATVNAGYRDGFSRLKEGEIRFVSLHGRLCRVVGQVCMDMFMCDVSGIKGAKVGDRVYLLGEKADMKLIAKNRETTAYEILTQFQHREDIIYK